MSYYAQQRQLQRRAAEGLHTEVQNSLHLCRCWTAANEGK